MRSSQILAAIALAVTATAAGRSSTGQDRKV